MNSTGGINEGRIEYYHNMMILLTECLASDAAYRMRCITARMAGVACGCVLPLVILLGVLGNGLVGYAMLAKIRPLSRQNVYFGCIALVDAVTMTLFGLVNFFLSRGLPWLSGGSVGYIMQNDGYIGRKMYMAVTTLCPLLSATMLLVMVADRVLSLVMPFRFRTLGPKFAFKCLLAAGLASIALSIAPVVVGKRDTFPGPEGSTVVFCFFSTNDCLMLLYWSFICNPPTIVLSGILLLNMGLLVCIVRLVRKRQRDLDSQLGPTSDASSIQHLNGAAVVFVQSTVQPAAQLPAMALYWALHVYGTKASKVDGTARSMVNSLAVIESLALVGQACSFPVMLQRSPKFRAYVTQRLSAWVPSFKPDNGGCGNALQLQDRL